MRKVIKKAFGLFDLELSRKSSKTGIKRPIGDFHTFLKQVKSLGLKCNTLLDIGANRAEWSALFKTIYPEANCIMVEPLKECEEYLKRFVDNHTGSRYFLNAAGSETTESTITIWDDLYGSSLLPANDKDKLSNGKQRVIQVVRIDDLLKKNNIQPPEVVKIDVQGFELEALKGAEGLFGKTELFILEVSLFSFDDVPGMPEFYEVVDFMFKRDYVVYDFPGFINRPYDNALGQCDIAFVKKNSFLRSSNKW